MKYRMNSLYTKQDAEVFEMQAYHPAELKESSSNDTSSFSDEDGKVLIPFPAQRVSCGLFGIVNDHIENYQSLDERFVKNKASTYFFEAESDSMSPLIMEGDVLIVDRSLEAHPGRIVIASLNGEMFCKRLKVKNGRSYLQSDNPAYAPMEITEESDFSVFGVVRGVARELGESDCG